MEKNAGAADARGWDEEGRRVLSGRGARKKKGKDPLASRPLAGAAASRLGARRGGRGTV